MLLIFMSKVINLVINQKEIDLLTIFLSEVIILLLSLRWNTANFIPRPTPYPRISLPSGALNTHAIVRNTPPRGSPTHPTPLFSSMSPDKILGL